MSHHEIDADTTSVFYAAPDLNGVARGKQIPGAHADKVLAGTARMPLSVLNVDLLGHDIEDSPLVFETGDQDGILQPTERGIVPMPWLEKSSALLPVSMFSEGGTPFSGDPRHALKSVMERYSSRGWNVVAATELEFYLVDASANELKPPRSLLSARRLSSGEILSLDALEEFSPFFSDLYEGCALMGIGADAASSEGGPGQFEINLKHGDALKIADDTWLFKMLVRGLARKHGLSATFMAKPFADQPGNGLHVHFSVVDLDGKNVFDDGTNQGSNIMRHAVAGLLNAMAPHTAIFAPHSNSFTRLVPGSHAPVGIAWGYENRTTALRIPGGPNAARRIEHRVAGGDTNPYLLLAAILGAAMDGIETEKEPPKPVVGDAYSQKLEEVPNDWDAALDLFQEKTNESIFDPQLIDNFIRTKQQEKRVFEDLDATQQTAVYLSAL